MSHMAELYRMRDRNRQLEDIQVELGYAKADILGGHYEPRPHKGAHRLSIVIARLQELRNELLAEPEPEVHE